ncbi:hypothetical protein CR194_10420 [Salipaludibacillus keqinensis]|uniref:Uncharacterized protein n=1 Tax=Salipaludibacillus keqinensis TaxID=2045207 RepID=A0A323TF85_9BACI|nr:hypothetical protein [Salipaludibacillus keqinensis]PYZ93569.1 hypothetical protein CR194_10420 [Salipaludibacillus keqinensis]
MKCKCQKHPGHPMPSPYYGQMMPYNHGAMQQPMQGMMMPENHSGGYGESMQPMMGYPQHYQQAHQGFNNNMGWQPPQQMQQYPQQMTQPQMGDQGMPNMGMGGQEMPYMEGNNMQQMGQQYDQSMQSPDQGNSYPMQGPNTHQNQMNGYPGMMPQTGYVPEEHDDDFD